MNEIDLVIFMMCVLLLIPVVFMLHIVVSLIGYFGWKRYDAECEHDSGKRFNDGAGCYFLRMPGWLKRIMLSLERRRCGHG